MKTEPTTTNPTLCYHCGDKLPRRPISRDEKSFCCAGCATVYTLLTESGMDAFYQLEERPGIKAQAADDGRFAYLDLDEVQQRLISFREGKHARVTLKLPAIHCSSCIWLLENMYQIDDGVEQVHVNFTRKEAAILFNPKKLTLRQLVELLVRLGYTPEINLATFQQEGTRVARGLYYKIGIAGFCFGNIMLLSLPEYLGMGEEWIHYARFFGTLNILLALPVFFYAASDYFRSAWAAVRHGRVNIDVPITLGIFALFGRSLYEILSATGAGYMDSLAGLVFFLLIGKWFQEKTYQSLAFDRNYDSYFPVAATVLEKGQERQVPLRDLKPGMEILVRNHELIPADADLLSSEATIDFSFVTGESDPVYKQQGAFVYAGGRQSGPAIRLRVRQKVDQSYLTDLWNQQAFQKSADQPMLAFIDTVSKRFTFAVLAIALVGGVFWWFRDPGQVVQIVTAVLIVACPCALALSAPFSFGHALRILGRNHFYLRNAETVEQLAAITAVVFDKTGTLTHTDHYTLTFKGEDLSPKQKERVATLAAQSNHPLSRTIAQHLGCSDEEAEVLKYREVPGSGVQGQVNGDWVVLGSERFVTGARDSGTSGTRVYLKVEEQLLGYFEVSVSYREGFDRTLTELGKRFALHLLSGDRDGELSHLSQWLSPERMHFNQSPFDKLQYIEKLRKKGHRVLMLGDGLNDAGALKAADVGVAVADNVYEFTPACDAIFDGNVLRELPKIIDLARSSMSTVRWSIVLSFLYNIIGLGFALSGLLSPLVAAILMPVSSVSVVLFTTLAVNWSARRKGLFYRDSPRN